MAAFTGITLPSKYIGPLSAEQSRQSGFTHSATIPYTVLNTITGGTTGDTIDVAIGTTPANFLIDRALIQVTTAFTTASTGTLTAGFGISSSVAVYVAAQNMLTAGPKAATAGAVPAGSTSTTGAAAVTLTTRFTTGTAGVLTDIASGSVTIYWRMIDLNTIDNSNG